MTSFNHDEAWRDAVNPERPKYTLEELNRVGNCPICNAASGHPHGLGCDMKTASLAYIPPEYREEVQAMENARLRTLMDSLSDQEFYGPSISALLEKNGNPEDFNYRALQDVLDRAYDQASSGKGAERHGQDKPFHEQPMQKLIDLYGVGFALGQAGKKAQESMRLGHEAAVRELLGAINYIAGAIIHMERNRK